MMDEEKPKKPQKRQKRQKRDKTRDAAVRSLSAFFTQQEEMFDAEKEKRSAGIDNMCAQMNEHLSSFVLLGYSIDGEPVNVTCANSQKDLDSLNTCIHRFIMSQSLPRNFPGSLLD